ncbi:hypothetical protein LTR53_011884 [Teratosphaeriaceae sp. CCFEE 6253]|nr:hypothetical protein LTR53_011884 [Teratosphaeriaceae sp. CCFEE 6253]
MASVKGIPDFTPLSDTIAIFRPDTKAGAPRKDPNETVIVCSWFRALPKHIAKYTAAWRSRRPHAQILLIQSGVSGMLLTSNAKQQADMRPALEVLKAARAADHNILLHVFSNGGSNSAVQLALAWRKDTHTSLPIHVMALDSCPGPPGLRLAASAVVESMPKNQRWWAVVFVWTVVVPLFVLPMLFGSPNFVEWLRSNLNDNTLFSRDVPRVYLYSRVDRMVPWTAVQEHCASAHNAGYAGTLVRFRASPHVAHVNEDKERYWIAVDAVQQSFAGIR